MKPKTDRIQNRVTAAGDVFLYGVIGDEFDELDAATLVEQINALGNIDLVVHINSGGGFVFEGLAIYNRLANHPAGVTVEIDGLAASMASVIAMAGDTVTMPDNARLMIHNPWDLSIGDAEQLRKDAEKLDSVKQSLVEIYRKKSGLQTSEIEAMMDAETWLDAEQALAQGFIDEITEPERMAACIDLAPFKFKHAPKELLAMAEETKSEPKTGTRAERQRASKILGAVRAAKLDTAFAEELIDSDLSLDQAKAAIVDRWAEQGGPTDHISNVNPAASGGATFDNQVFRVQAMAEAMACRYAPITPSEPAREFVHMSALDMARHCLEANGLNTRAMSKSRIIQTAMAKHTTSDFPELLLGAGDRILRQAYEAAPAGLKRVARQTTATDFRAKSHLQLGEAPKLEKVLENGEFKHGTMSEAKETYSVATYGRIFGLSRQALINDDLGAFADASIRFGRAAAEFEAQFLVDLLTSNPTMGDGDALFHANHGNLEAAGGPPIVASLDNARKDMRLQKGLDGTTPINTAPRFLVVPAALETIAEQLIATITPMMTDDVNPFAGKLEAVVEPRLDAVSSTAWYLVGDPDVIDGLEYAYLEEAQGPQFFVRDGWTVDGVEFKVRDDFGGGFLDWRGFYKNPGV